MAFEYSIRLPDGEMRRYRGYDANFELQPTVDPNDGALADTALKYLFIRVGDSVTVGALMPATGPTLRRAGVKGGTVAPDTSFVASARHRILLGGFIGDRGGSASIDTVTALRIAGTFTIHHNLGLPPANLDVAVIQGWFSAIPRSK